MSYNGRTVAEMRRVELGSVAMLFCQPTDKTADSARVSDISRNRSWRIMFHFFCMKAINKLLIA